MSTYGVVIILSCNLFDTLREDATCRMLREITICR